MVSNRLVHRIIATNVSLNKMKVTRNDKCSFCNEETESIQHLLWECSLVQHFWKSLEGILKEKCEHLEHLKLTQEIILFGNQLNFKSDTNFDFIVMLALFVCLFVCYICKIDNIRP